MLIFRSDYHPLFKFCNPFSDNTGARFDIAYNIVGTGRPFNINYLSCYAIVLIYSEYHDFILHLVCSTLWNGDTAVISEGESKYTAAAGEYLKVGIWE